MEAKFDSKGKDDMTIDLQNRAAIEEKEQRPEVLH
jgi:hypothetical protein